jgi:23S rRNA (uracil1939-C5)-methyltransferase
VVGVSASANDHGGNVIRTAPSARLEGQYTIIEPVGPIALGLSAAGFSQLNQDVMARMYQRAAGLVEQERPVVWDLYCGVGGLGLTVAQKKDGTTLFGADSVDSAVSLANQNSQDNGVSGRFATIDLSRTAPRGWPEPDVVLLNPPRRGIDDVIKRRLTEIQPRQLIYMSCNPTSFAKDVRFLVDRGYRLDEVHAYDMLPRTAHVEVLAALVREP